MEQLKAFTKRYSWPLLILGVMVVAYGLQIHRLGYYWDDWVYLFRYRTGGIFNTIFYQGSRQLGSYALAPGFLFSGSSALRWHIYALVLRWALSLAVLWHLRLLWPEHKTQTGFMAMLFAVYLAFSQHSISVIYSIHYMVYLLFFLSLGLMVLAVKAEKIRWVYFAFSLALQALHMFMFEYFVGLELLRPFVLWFVFSSKDTSSTLDKLKRVGKQYGLYLLVLAGYLAWRLGLLGGEFLTYDHETFFELFKASPIQAVTSLAFLALRDLYYVLVETWFNALNIGLIQPDQPFNLLAVLVGLLTAVGLFYLLNKVFMFTEEGKGSSRNFQQQAFVFGLAATIFAFIPSWFVGREIISDMFSDRFSLPALFGASIFLVVVVEWLTGGDRTRRVVALGLFVGLAVNAQFRITNDYRWEWTRQLKTYWELSWRAPSIQPGTTIFGNGRVTTHVNNYVVTFVLNEIYQTFPEDDQLAYWWERYSTSRIPNNLDNFFNGVTYQGEFAENTFEMTYPNTLTAYVVDDQCFRFLAPKDRKDKYIATEYREAAALSHPESLISDDPGFTLVKAIFGREPERTWCYYYEKAELAAQLGDWGKVAALKAEADQNGYRSDIQSEYLVFIEGFGKMGDWDQALDLSLEVYDRNPAKIAESLCSLWLGMGEESGNSEAYEAGWEQMNANIGCTTIP